MKPNAFPRIGKLLLAALLPLAALIGAFLLPGEPPGRRPGKSLPSAALAPPDSRRAALETLLRTGRLALDATDYPRAEKAFREARTRAETLQDVRAQARAMDNLGNVYSGQGRPDRALRLYREARTLFDKSSSPRDAARCDNNLGVAHLNLGQFDRAAEHFQRALDFYAKQRDDKNIAECCNNLGAAYGALGQPARALDFYGQALSRRLTLNEPQDTADTCNNLGILHGELGQYERALFYHRKALALRRSLGNSQDIADSYANLGAVYGLAGQYEAAVERHKDALRRYLSLGNDLGVANCQNNLGVTDTRLGRYADAVNRHRDALRRYEKLDERQGVADTLLNLGAAYSHQGQKRAALRLYERALTRYQALGNPQAIGSCLDNLGSVYASLNQPRRALAFYRRALTQYETVSGQGISPSSVGAYQETLHNFYGFYARLLLRQGQAADALTILERGRAQGMARQRVQAQINIAELFSAEDAARWKATYDEMMIANGLLGATGPTATEREDAARRSERAEQRLGVLRDALRKRYPAFRRLDDPPRPTSGDLVALAQRHPQTLFLEWTYLEDGPDSELLVFALDKRGVRGEEVLLGDNLLPRRAQTWRDSIQAARLAQDSRTARRQAQAYRQIAANEPRLARAFYDLLFGPLARRGAIASDRYQRLILVGDGPLLGLPFAALAISENQRLIDRYALSSAVSLASLTPGKAENASPVRPTETMLCAADPAGDGDPAPVSGRDRSAPPLGPLPFAHAEAEAITALFPGGRTRLLLGAEATESAVTAAMPRYRILHFATHAVLDEANGLRSYLAFSPASREAQIGGAAPAASFAQGDGRLEAREVMTMRLGAELIVLSACQSAQGQRSGGEGLLGLAWGFGAAGCPSVVGTEWEVNDAATAQLMSAFYRGLSRGERKDDALRAAMQTLRRDPRNHAPFFWAGALVIGDAGPLTPPH